MANLYEVFAEAQNGDAAEMNLASTSDDGVTAVIP